jgi:hypothetical protein
MLKSKSYKKEFSGGELEDLHYFEFLFSESPKTTCHFTCENSLCFTKYGRPPSKKLFCFSGSEDAGSPCRYSL